MPLMSKYLTLLTYRYSPDPNHDEDAFLDEFIVPKNVDVSALNKEIELLLTMLLLVRGGIWD